jgi:carboxyl-terminal processing protease
VLIDDSKPFVDRPLNAAIDVLKKKIGGVGEAPTAPPVRRFPERIAG